MLPLRLQVLVISRRFGLHPRSARDFRDALPAVLGPQCPLRRGVIEPKKGFESMAGSLQS